MEHDDVLHARAHGATVARRRVKLRIVHRVEGGSIERRRGVGRNVRNHDRRFHVPRHVHDKLQHHLDFDRGSAGGNRDLDGRRGLRGHDLGARHGRGET